MGLGLLEFETVGMALDPLASLMNHSCDPNAVYLFEGTTIRVRSLKPISPGQEIFISYTDNTMDYDIRNHLLKSR
jgi:SET and MYND domain-containing protein